jgi:hypothetical protein
MHVFLLDDLPSDPSIIGVLLIIKSQQALFCYVLQVDQKWGEYQNRHSEQNTREGFPVKQHAELPGNGIDSKQEQEVS